MKIRPASDFADEPPLVESPAAPENIQNWRAVRNTRESFFFPQDEIVKPEGKKAE